MIVADSSTRFILADDAEWTANLAALWAADPELAADIEATESLPAYATEPTRSGVPTVALAEPNAPAERRIYLHSRFEPLAEAQRLAEQASVTERSAFFIQGFGLGYHVQALFDLAEKESLIAVIEPDLLLLRTALQCRDYSKLIDSKRLIFFTKPHKPQFFNRLTSNSALFASGFEIIAHPPSVRVAPDFHRQMRNWVCDFASYCNTSVTTLVINGRLTFENIARNLPWYGAAPGVERLRGCYAKKPAIIVSAGPSLRKNKHLLKQAQGHAVLIAVQTTLWPLLESDITPEFVTSLDYHEICTRFFQRLPPTLRTELVAEPKATNAIFDLHPGPLTLLGNSDAELLLGDSRQSERKPTLRAGATVAHLAYYLAEHMGCDPIIFVGQDLGFSDGLCYAPGTSYEDVWRPELSRFCTIEMKQWEQIVRDRHILRQMTDCHGNPIYTEERLFTYLQQFERDFADAGAQIIDATEGGVLKRGAEPMPLAEALDQFCRAPLSGGPLPHPGLDWRPLRAMLDPLSRRRSEAEEIARISRQTLEHLKEIRDHMDDQTRVNRVIAQVDRLRARINDLGACYYLVTQLMQQGELRRFRADRRLAAQGLRGIDRQRGQTERDIDHVEDVLDAAGDFVLLMDQVMQRIEVCANREMKVAA
jgi:hypothetical protein